MTTTHRKENLRQVSKEFGLKLDRLRKHRTLEANTTSSPVIPHPADSASLCIQLVDTRSLKLVSCQLGQAPAYVAISHVWAEKLFPIARKSDIGNAIGYQLVIAALYQKSPQIHHIWVDTWCIDQDNNIDKHRQMRSMGEIYRTADFVLVTLSHNLNQTQSDLNDIMSKFSKSAEILDRGEAWGAEFLEYLDSAEVVEPLVRGFAFLQSLMRSAWSTRLWCFQEAALAKEILWIGLDRVPLHLSDMTLVAILDLPFINTQLQKRLGSHLEFSRVLMKPLVDHRLGWRDRTCVMEAAYLRNSTIREDEIYGLMGASVVIIEPDPTKSMEMLWQKWWEEAIRLGHIRWLMLSWKSSYLNLSGDMEYARSGCVVPPCQERSHASRCSILHNCRPYGAVSVRKDCVKVPGHCVGTCSSFIHLGRAVHISDVLSCFMTVAWLGRGDLELTMRIVAVMWYSNTSRSQIQSISQILRSEYDSSSMNIEKNPSMQHLYEGRGNEECDLIKTISDDFFYFLGGTNRKELYLTTIENEMKKTDVIMQASEPIAPGEFLALDLNATLERSLRVLMMAQVFPEIPRTASSKSQTQLHKVGITMPVGYNMTVEHLAAPCDDSPLPLEEFTFPSSRSSCSVCQLQDSTAPDIKRWLGDLHEKGAEKIFAKEIQVEYQRRFGHGQVKFLPDVNDRAFIDEVVYRDEHGRYSFEEDSETEHDPASGNTTEDNA